MNSTTNPYSTHASNSAPNLSMDVSDQFKVHQKEEQEQKAPKTLPFTAETFKEHLSDMYGSLIEIKKGLNRTEKEPKRDKQAIKDASKIIDDIAQKITMDLSNCIDKLYL
ncbi:hypothetical protein [Flavobacterium sp.]|jgi:hypothetical protein|uniref:hypothetical protein n=1 Tax=Flavobacterium sp. TaxID=239 RepID=UPI0037C03470